MPSENGKRPNQIINSPQLPKMAQAFFTEAENVIEDT